MTVEVLNPDGLVKPDGYRQVAIATGSRMVFLAGQVARDAHGTPIGTGDLAAQTEQALRNVNTALTGAGGTFSDVAKLTLFIVDWTPDKMAALGDGVGRAVAALGIDPLKAITLIGVAALAEPDLLIEIDAIAVLP
jgi:enamine deaminase RidA (YjgF/YER057c/UK114 family)